MSLPSFAEGFNPNNGLINPIDEDTARSRDRRKRRYAVAWDDRCLVVNRADGTMYFHSLSAGRQRGYLAYGLARKTRQWRLSHIFIQGADEDQLLIEVPLWEGRARVSVAPFESPRDLAAPSEALRAFAPPTFGDWAGALALPTDPRKWIDVPEEFDVP